MELPASWLVGKRKTYRSYPTRHIDEQYLTDKEYTVYKQTPYRFQYMHASDSEISSLVFLNSFIKNHARLGIEQELAYIRAFRYAYDVRHQLLKEQIRLRKEIANSEPGLDQYRLEKELLEVDDLLQHDPQVRNIHIARNILIEHNLKLIIKVALAYQAKGLPIDDLIQEGTLGFIRAIEKYDPNEGVKLGTYAVWWIRQKITRALSNKTRIIRLPVHVTAEVTKVLKFIKQNKLDVHGQYVKQIAEGLGFTPEKVKEIFFYIISFNPANQILTGVSVGDGYSHEGDEESSVSSDVFGHILDHYCSHTDKTDAYLIYEDMQQNLNSNIAQLSQNSQFILAYKFGWNDYEAHSYIELEREFAERNEKTVGGKQLVQQAVLELLNIMFAS